MSNVVTDEEILTEWNNIQTVKGVSKKLDISYHKVLKSLSSSGIIINDTHRQIMKYYNQGKSVKEIAEIMQMNNNVVQSYLPRKRSTYNVNPSENALRIKKSRQKS